MRSSREAAKDQPAYRDLPWMTEEQLLNRAGSASGHRRDGGPRSARHGPAVHRRRQARPPRQAGGRFAAAVSRLLAAAEKQKLLVQMGYMFRYNPAVLLLRKFLKEGWLGEVFEVHTVMSKVVPPAQRLELAEFRGGIMFELGCHVIDLVVGVLGKPQRVNPFPRTSGAHGDQLADNMLAVLDYPQATASVKSSAIEIDGGSRRHFVVCGTAGTFHIQPLDAPDVRLTLDRDRGEYKKGTQEIKFGNYRAVRRRRGRHGARSCAARRNATITTRTTWRCRRRCFWQAECRRRRVHEMHLCATSHGAFRYRSCTLPLDARRSLMRFEHFLHCLAHEAGRQGIAFDAAGTGDVDAHGLAVEIDDWPAAFVGLEHRIVLNDGSKTIRAARES